jgi:DNA repair exonuclease SbcCD ATPase subunit
MINHFRDKLNQRKGKQHTLLESLEKKKNSVLVLDETMLDLKEATMIAQLLANEATDKLASKFNDIVSVAIQTVFGDEYEFKMKIESKNNNITATPVLYKSGIEESFRASSGGGAMAIASLALRVALLTLTKNPTPIFILDEVFKAIGDEQIEKACQLVQTISENLGIQFIVVTHSKEIKNTANRIFSVSRGVTGNSKVSVMDKETFVMEEQ